MSMDNTFFAYPDLVVQRRGPLVTLIMTTLLQLLGQLAVVTSAEKEHVHIKIYVPEIIERRVHTKTIYVHTHEPKKSHERVVPTKASVTVSSADYYEEGRKEERKKGRGKEWYAIASYGGRGISDTDYSAGLQDDKRGAGGANGDEDYSMLEPPPMPPQNDPGISNYYAYEGDNKGRVRLLGVKSLYPNGIVGLAYPPQYDVRENVIETDDGTDYRKPATNEDDNNSKSKEYYDDYSHEEGHRNGGETYTGHSYNGELDHSFKEEHEESNEAISVESEEREWSKRKRFGGDLRRLRGG